MATEIRAVQGTAGDAEEVVVDLHCDEIEDKSCPQPSEPLTPEAWREAILSTVVEVEKV